MQQLKKSYGFNEIYANKHRGTLIDALEAAIAALWSSLSTNTQGDTSDVLTDYDIRYSMQKVNAYVKEAAERNRTAWFIHSFVKYLRLLQEIVIEKSFKLRENLFFETIRSQAREIKKSLEGSETIIRIPKQVML